VKSKKNPGEKLARVAAERQIRKMAFRSFYFSGFNLTIGV
jgi:hypothetical protein